MKRKWLLVFIVLVLLLAGAGWRLSRTAEFIARFGSDRARADLCRALPTLSPERQTPLQLRLLADPVQEVRLACLTACEKGAPSHEIDDVLLNVLSNQATPGMERSRAGEILLGRTPVREEVLPLLERAASDASFRRDCPRLYVRMISRSLPQATLEERQKLVDGALNPDDPAAEALQQLVLAHPESFAAWRERFADVQEGEGIAPGLQQFCSAAAAAIEAKVSSSAEASPAMPEPEAASKEPYSVWEGAWAQEIRPNYQVAVAHEHLCLALEEGAGGVMSWLKGEDGTVDVGEARFSLLAPRDGNYALWGRIWFDDKCGNSFGIWLDDAQLGNFSDGTNTMREWHWLQFNAAGPLALKKGFHAGRLQAWEDGVCIEKLALLPEGMNPDAQTLASVAHWDKSQPSSLSISAKYQSQQRGTTQPLTVYVRRNSPALTAGTVHLKVPAPFVVEGGASDQVVRFADGDPMATATFQVKLPADAVAGEAPVRATYADASGKIVRGQAVLGAQFDWFTTGPLAPADALASKLQAVTTVSDADLKSGWSRYPVKGLDAYRRLNFEYGYGAIMDKFIFLCADIKVTKSDDYLGLLTADDTAVVFIDGKQAIEQPGGGPGEGRLVMEPIHLEAGTHRVFARVYQDSAENPAGEDKYRHTWNHCNMKLLLRKKRHEPADTILGLPRPDEKK